MRCDHEHERLVMIRFLTLLHESDGLVGNRIRFELATVNTLGFVVVVEIVVERPTEIVDFPMFVTEALWTGWGEFGFGVELEYFAVAELGSCDVGLGFHVFTGEFTATSGQMPFADEAGVVTGVVKNMGHAPLVGVHVDPVEDDA